MPATIEKKEKQCRMDIRLTRAQRASYERAASLRGKTLTQWVTAHLDENASKDIDEATTTVLSREAFEAFCDILDAPIPDGAQKLLAQKAVWE